MKPEDLEWEGEGIELHMYYHLVFGVKYADALIDPVWEEELHTYTAGVLTALNCRSVYITGTEDHMHLAIQHKSQRMSLNDLVDALKQETAKWINRNHPSKHPFEWQESYVSVTFWKDDQQIIAQQLSRQKEYHKHTNLQQEMRAFLVEHGFEEDAEDPFDPLAEREAN